MIKETLKQYPDRKGVSLRGKEWTLWIQRVHRSGTSEPWILIKMLKANQATETQPFTYSEPVRPIWLTPEQFEQYKAMLEKCVSARS